MSARSSARTSSTRVQGRPRALRPAGRRDRAHRRGPGRAHRVIELVVTDLDGSLWVRGDPSSSTRRGRSSSGIPVIVAAVVHDHREPLAAPGSPHCRRAERCPRARPRDRRALPPSALRHGASRTCPRRVSGRRATTRACTWSTPRSRSTSAPGHRPIRDICTVVRATRGHRRPRRDRRHAAGARLRRDRPPPRAADDRRRRYR